MCSSHMLDFFYNNIKKRKFFKKFKICHIEYQKIQKDKDKEKSSSNKLKHKRKYKPDDIRKKIPLYQKML